MPYKTWYSKYKFQSKFRTDIEDKENAEAKKVTTR